MKRIFALLMVAVFFLGSSFSFASTDLLLSNKSLYFMIEKHNAEKLLENFAELEKIDFVKFLGSETPLKLEMNIEIDSSAEEFIKRDIQILDEVNEKAGYERAEIKVYNDDKYIATLEAIEDGTVLSLRLPELYEKYITVDLGKLTELCEKFGMPEDELKELEKSYKMQEELKALMALSEEQEEDLTNCVIKCGMKLNNLLKEEYFVRDNQAVVSYDDKIIPCTSLSMEIPQRDMIQIVKALWTEIKNDERVMKIFEEKLNGFYEIYKEELDEETQLPTITEICEAIDGLFTRLEEMYGPAYDNGRIVSKIYFGEDYNIIKREFGIKNESADYSTMMSLTTLEDYYALEGDTFALKDRIVVNGKVTTHNFTYGYLTYDYDWDELDNLIKTEKLETAECAVNIEKLSENALRLWMDLDEFTKFEVNLATEKLNKNSAVLKLDMLVLEKANPDLTYIKEAKDTEVTCKMEMKVTQNHKIVKKNLSKNEININKMSKEELEKEWNANKEKIAERGEKLYRDLFPEMVSSAERIKVSVENIVDAQSKISIM
ncbi:MAG: hypothetical protein J6M02_03735 [Clostridia bacterium]|nr:hypothetical protein [Clostridia bacterium]